MRRFKTLLIGGVIAALAVTASGAPTAAQLVEKGRVVFVNGIPGTKVDICVNGREIRSALPYGGKKYKTMFAAGKTLKAFKADPRTCKGTLLAQKRFDLLPDAELTLVVTKNKPGKVRIFSSSTLVIAPSAAFRHAGDMGLAALKYDLWLKVLDDEPLEPINPAANGVAWKKGSHSHAQFPEGGVIRVRARPYGRTRVMAVSPAVFYDPARCVEWILVGTSAKNARFVLVYRNVLGQQ